MTRWHRGLIRARFFLTLHLVPGNKFNRPT